MDYIIKTNNESGFWTLMNSIGFDVCVGCNCIVEFDDNEPFEHTCTP